MIGKLNKEEDIPIGNLIINRVPKLTFEKFHEMSRDQFKASKPLSMQRSTFSSRVSRL